MLKRWEITPSCRPNRSPTTSPSGNLSRLPNLFHNGLHGCSGDALRCSDIAVGRARAVRLPDPGPQSLTLWAGSLGGHGVKSLCTHAGAQSMLPCHQMGQAT